MNIVYYTSALVAIVFILCYMTHPKWLGIVKNPYFLIVVLGLTVRIAATKIDFSYYHDVNCFKAWADMLFQNGFSNFYLSEAFTDYPPGYMYILYFIGMIRKVFNLDYNSYIFTLITMLPAILFDIATGVLLYKIAAKRIKPHLALVLTMAYILNPAVIIDSSVWGQVDSVYTFFIFISIYYVTEKEYLKSFFLFAIALLIKPQALIFSPIYVFVFYDCVNENNYSRESFLKMFGYSGLAGLLIVIGIFPFSKNFDFMPIINQYAATITSYPYATLNAYNFFGFIGANWTSVSDKLLFFTYSTWGIIFLNVIVIFAFLMLNRNKIKANYFFIAAAINTLTFMFSMRMHERYLFPTFLLLLAAFAYKFNKKIILLYVGLSITFVINCCDVLADLCKSYDMSVINTSIIPVSFINLALTAFMIYLAFNVYKPKESEPLETEASEPQAELSGIESEVTEIKPIIPEPSSPPLTLTKMDWTLLIGLIIVYSVIAFINLGNLHSPQTTWEASKDTEITVDFGKEYRITRMDYMVGAKIGKNFGLSFSSDSINWGANTDYVADTVFNWKMNNLDATARYAKILSYDDELFLQEMAFRDENNNIIPITGFSGSAQALFDEQQYAPETSTFMNSTYFDEIYHARTAYEFINKLSVYEWTHPPLGKFIISLGIRLFGMTPFGWRFTGTLFGILMIPFLYIFCKKIFNNTNWAFFGTFIFTFDFMHFAQTRIATIDSYVTFFIICMYFFMYLYCTKSFYYTKLYKTLIPLALSGVFMGLAVSVKWQGAYAVAGLPVVFFYTLYKRYKEYKYSEHNEPFSNINTSVFPKYTAITLASCVVFFIVIPVVIYCLSYIPFMQTPGNSGIGIIFKNQVDMFNYHSKLVATHPYESKWWTWPFDIRPIFYFSGSVTDEIKRGISSFGNPAVWWMGIVAIFYCMNEALKKQNNTLIFLLTALAAQYLPWTLVSRSLYIYHYFPSIPFIVLLITYFFKDYVSQLGFKLRFLKLPVIYACVVVLLFGMFYPVLSGTPVLVKYVHMFLKWLPTWQLI